VQVTVGKVHQVTEGDQHCIPALRKSGLTMHCLFNVSGLCIGGYLVLNFQFSIRGKQPPLHP